MVNRQLKLFDEKAFEERQVMQARENVEELIKKNPTRKELAMYLCAEAERSMFGIDETPEWDAVNEYEFFEVTEFKVDLTDVEKANKEGQMGMPIWRYVGNDK